MTLSDEPTEEMQGELFLKGFMWNAHQLDVQVQGNAIT